MYGLNFFFRETEIFSKFSDEGHPPFAAQPVPGNISNKITYHETYIGIKKVEDSKLNQKPRQKGNDWSFNYGNRNNYQVLVVNNELYDIF